MTSANKLEANRLNSLRSTGPRTPEGKRIASRNATKLGLFTRELLLQEESELELHLLARAVRSDLQPNGPMEQTLVELIISVLWRLRRLLKIETGLFGMYRFYKGVDGGAPVAFAHDASQLDCFSRVAQMEAALERRLYRALDELTRLQRSRIGKGADAIDIEANQPSDQSAQPVGSLQRWLGASPENT